MKITSFINNQHILCRVWLIPVQHTLPIDKDASGALNVIVAIQHKYSIFGRADLGGQRHGVFVWPPGCSGAQLCWAFHLKVCHMVVNTPALPTLNPYIQTLIMIGILRKA